MTAELPLDSRQEAIARALLLADRPVSADALAAELHLTDRVVRYNLPSVAAYFAARGLRLARRPGVGIWAEGPAHARAAVATALDATSGPAVLDPGDRKARILLALLRAAPEALSSRTFEDRLGVSPPTIRRDVREAEAWLEKHRLHLRRIPGVGIAVAGSELDTRGGLLGIVLESAPPNLLSPDRVAAEQAAPGDRPPSDVERFVGELDLPTMRAVLTGVYPRLAPDDPSLASAALYLGILVFRVRGGHPAQINAGGLRSLLDHPASLDAARIAGELHDRARVALAPREVAAITEGLLGLQIVEADPGPTPVDTAMIDRVLRAAADRLHPALLEDDQLRASLTEHLRRLQVRIRFGLPVSNPLHQEVRRRYPDVYRVAAEVIAEVEPAEPGPMPSEEVGLLTMYLAGSLERLRLRPKILVTVVCPAGMATAWILVSRLLAEFPQLEVQRVVSRAALGSQADSPGDLVISTVPIEGDVGAPAVVVSPLLRELDIRRLGRAIAALD